MKKMKKFVTVSLAGIMLLGMTLTASAAHSVHNWRALPVSKYCSSCKHTCAVMECTSGYPSVHHQCAHGHGA